MKISKTEWKRMYREAVVHWDDIINFIIKHYDKVYNAYNLTAIAKGIEYEVNYRGEACSYCKKFSYDFCGGCPIAVAADETGCYGTPWHDFAISETSEDLLKLGLEERKFIIDTVPKQIKGYKLPKSILRKIEATNKKADELREKYK